MANLIYPQNPQSPIGQPQEKMQGNYFFQEIQEEDGMLVFGSNRTHAKALAKRRKERYKERKNQTQ